MDKLKRCQKGTRRNKKTKKCETHKKATKPILKKKTQNKQNKTNEIYVIDLEKTRRKRCPKGMTRIKDTTLCKVKDEKENTRTTKETPTYKDSLEDLIRSYNKNKTDQVIPYECFKSSNVMMLLHIIECNPKTACLYNILHIGSLESRKNRLFFSSDTHRKRFIESIKTQYKECKKK